MNYLLLLIFSITYTSISLACENINLYELKASVRAVPVYDQDSTGTCFAYTAAQLIDMERFDNGVDKDKRIHPLWAAYAYNKVYKSNDSLEGGFVAKAVKALRKEGICTYKEASSLIAKYKEGTGYSDPEFLDVLENMGEQNSLEKRLSIEERLKNKELKACRAKTDSFHGKKILKNIDSLLGITKKLVSAKDVMKEVFKPCIEGGELPLVDLKKLKSDMCTSCYDSEIGNYILKQLKRKKPVSIGYCSGVLYDTKADFIKDRDLSTIFDNRMEASRKKEKCGYHASLILGSRKHGNKCQFLLKNTWGDWKSSTWKQCLCEVSKGKYEACTKGDKKSNSVGCWIDREALQRNVRNITHF